MRADLTPPQDLDAERSVLGSMLMSKDAISDTCLLYTSDAADE